MRIMLARFLVFALGLGLLVPPADATDFYVNASTGDDLHAGLCPVAGTPAGCNGPWATINHADQALTPGTPANCGATGSYTNSSYANASAIAACVHVAPGTYFIPITTNRAGTATGRIRWLCDTQGACNLNESSNGTIWQANGGFTDYVGFTFDGTGHAGVATGITIGAQDSLFQANRVHDIGSACFTSQNAAVGTFFNVQAGHGNRYIGNRWYHNNCGSGHVNGDGAAMTALAMDSYDTAQRNLIVDHGTGYAVQVSHGFPDGSGGHLGTNQTFSNNTIVNVDRGIVLGYVNSTDFDTLSNNIIANVTGNFNAIRIHGPCGSHEVVAANLIYNAGPIVVDAGFSCAVTPTGTLTGTDAGTFVSYTGTILGDYHLRAGSPAIGRGVPTCALTGCVTPLDLDGNAETTPPSIGVYASGGGGAPTPPSAPTALSVTPH